VTSFAYPGDELDVFAKATTWKAYWRSQILQYVKGDVLDVGAGIGTNVQAFPLKNVKTWTCLEPDENLCKRAHSNLPATTNIKIIQGFLGDLPQRATFDCILYIDVLEHILNDRAELGRATAHLRSEGYLIVVSPAYQWLFTPFDQAIGHFRRYSELSLRDAGPSELSLILIRHLDCAGLLASMANRFLFRQSNPTESQVLAWDRYLVPLSRFFDRMLMYRFGRSIIAVWRRAA
jgi:2-polyprenyl-3-methyl-5-hydroxy-6-metoxy-1,4-benzoquinol methylase